MSYMKVLGETSGLFLFFFNVVVTSFFTIRMTNVYIASEVSLELGGSGQSW